MERGFADLEVADRRARGQLAQERLRIAMPQLLHLAEVAPEPEPTKGAPAQPSTGPVAFFDMPEMIVTLNTSTKAKTAFMKIRLSLEVPQSSDLGMVRPSRRAEVEYSPRAGGIESEPNAVRAASRQNHLLIDCAQQVTPPPVTKRVESGAAGAMVESQRIAVADGWWDIELSGGLLTRGAFVVPLSGTGDTQGDIVAAWSIGADRQPVFDEPTHVARSASSGDARIVVGEYVRRCAAGEVLRYFGEEWNSGVMIAISRSSDALHARASTFSRSFSGMSSIMAMREGSDFRNQM